MLNLKSSHSTAFTPSSPAERYAEALASGQFMADEAQAQAVQELDRVWKELLNRYKASKKAFRRFRRQTSPKGVYMWGGVGRGKTWLMDQFYESVPFRRKTRMHFHHFMQHVHKELINFLANVIHSISWLIKFIKMLSLFVSMSFLSRT